MSGPLVDFVAVREENVMGPATESGDEIFFDTGEANGGRGFGNVVLVYDDWVALGKPDSVIVTIAAAAKSGE